MACEQRHCTLRTYACRCTLIDPRPQKLSKAQRKWLKEFAETKQQPTAALQRGNSCKLSTTDEAQQSATGVHYSPLSQQAKTESQQTNAASQKTTAEPHAIAEQRTVAAPQGTTVASQGAALTSATVGVAALKLSTGRTANAGTDNAHLPSCGHQADSTDWVDGCTLDSQLPITQSGVRQMQIPEAQPTTQLGEADLRGTLSQQIQVTLWHCVRLHVGADCIDHAIQRRVCTDASVVMLFVASVTAHRLGQLQTGVAANKQMQHSFGMQIWMLQ